MMIESTQNQTFKMLSSLTSAKGLKAEKLFILSGEKLIREFLAAPNLPIAFEVIASGMPWQTSDGAHKILELTPALFAELDVLGTHFSLLVLEQPPLPTLDMTIYEPHGFEVALPTGDPGNLGALLRSCEAFGVSRVILTQEAAHPFLPKSVKASAGSVLRLPLGRGPGLRDLPANAIALAGDGLPIDGFAWPQKGLLVVGEEGGYGMAEGRFETRLCIPTQGVESLNVVVAASIALEKRFSRSR